MATDFKKLQKKRRIIRLVKKLAGVLVFVAIAVGLYATRDKWFSKLEGIGGKYENLTTGSSSGAGFPLMISGGISYRSGMLDSCFALLDDTTLRLYNLDGELTDTRQHAFSNAIMKTSGKYLLVYDLGGSSVRLENRHKTLFTNELEGKIIFAELSPEGYTAVVTTSERYVCALTIFDSDGKNVYSRGCVERIISLCFTDGSDGCCAASVYADTGRLITRLDRYEFSVDAEVKSSSPLDTFCVSAYNSKNGVFVVGDNQCGFFDDECHSLDTEQFEAEVTAYAYGDAGCAVVLENTDMRREQLLLWRNPEKEPVTVETKLTCTDIEIYDDYAYLLSDTEVAVYDFDGVLRGYKKLNDSFDEIIPCSAGVLVRGYDKVELTDIPIN